MNNVINIVDRKRWGLLEHAHALDYFVNKNTDIKFSSKTYSVLNFEGINIGKLLMKKNTTMIFWSLGFCSLLIPLLRLRNKIIFISHEPGGLLQRLKKKDRLFYSVIVSAFELMMKFSHIIATPNKTNAKKFNFTYLPLLYKPLSSFNIEKSSESKKYCVYYLGRLDPRRGSEIFLELKKKYSNIYDFKTFPDKNVGKDEIDKVAYTRQKGCVFNFYSTKHNQSGVTGDALRLNLPVIVSNYDFISNEVESLKLGIVINPKDKSLKTIITNIEKLASRSSNNEIMTYYNNNFGENAFYEHWYKKI